MMVSVKGIEYKATLNLLFNQGNINIALLIIVDTHIHRLRITIGDVAVDLSLNN
jgi:thermostable 8-oxoguanine DNA glycosylase